MTETSVPFPRLDQYRALAHRLADATGPLILPHFRAGGHIDNKADVSTDTRFDPVTKADKDAERVMRTLIADAFPDHNIIGEEYDDTFGTSEGGAGEYSWVLDPIDGTRAFIMGLPTWGTLIALCHKGTPVLGLVNQPWTQERFEGDRESAHFIYQNHAAPLHTRPCPNFDTAILAATAPEIFTTPGEVNVFEKLTSYVRMRRFGGDCYNYCLLARGLIDIVVESSLKQVDVQALIPIVEGAGGIITDWKGRPNPTDGQVIAAGDKTLHATALDILAPAAT
ncbi:MAG: histidinol-phosphatase [Parvularculales bacterium]